MDSLQHLLEAPVLQTAGNYQQTAIVVTSIGECVPSLPSAVIFKGARV